MDVHIRWMIIADAESVLDIERRCFEHPWREGDFVRCLRQRNCIGKVAEKGDRVVGFVVYELYPKQISIIKFAVHPEEQRLGVGSELVRHLVRKPRKLRTRIAVVVAETNLIAQQFFKSRGFMATVVLRDYDDVVEDDYLMELKLRGSRS